MDRLHRELIGPTAVMVVMLVTTFAMLATSVVVDFENDSVWPFAAQLSRWSIAQRTQPQPTRQDQAASRGDVIRITDGEHTVVARQEVKREMVAVPVRAQRWRPPRDRRRVPIQQNPAWMPGVRWIHRQVFSGVVSRGQTAVRELTPAEAEALLRHGAQGRCWVAADGQRIVVLTGSSLLLLHPDAAFQRLEEPLVVRGSDRPPSVTVRRDEQLLQFEVGERVLRYDLRAGATQPLGWGDATFIPPALGRRLDRAAGWVGITLYFGALWIGWLAWFSRRGPRFWPLALAVTLGVGAAGGAALLVI